MLAFIYCTRATLNLNFPFFFFGLYYPPLEQTGRFFLKTQTSRKLVYARGPNIPQVQTHKNASELNKKKKAHVRHMQTSICAVGFF